MKPEKIATEGVLQEELHAPIAAINAELRVRASSEAVERLFSQSAKVMKKRSLQFSCFQCGEEFFDNTGQLFHDRSKQFYCGSC
jgi:ribosomal protein L44E